MENNNINKETSTDEVTKDINNIKQDKMNGVDDESMKHEDSPSHQDHDMYSCPMPEEINVTVEHTGGSQTEISNRMNTVTEDNVHSLTGNGADQPPPQYFTSYGNADIQSQLSTRTGYEVYVTEDGETGRIIISGNGSYQQNMGGSPNGVVTLGETNISTIASSDGNVLSLGEDAIEQLAGFENFPPGSIQVTTTQNADGTTHLQYYLNEDASIQDESNIMVNSRKVYQCNYEKCNKQFTSPYKLKMHSRSHTGESFTCTFDGCNKRFVSQFELHKHSKSHIVQKDFVCEVDGCKKEYTTAHHLKVHKRQHSGERPFICDWEGCGKMFTTGYGLKSHYRTHTNERPYKCNYDDCGKAFKTSGDLQKHIRTHTGERPFRCTFPGCDRSFTTSNIRKVHLRTHTGEKPYQCEVEGCGRTFASATNYKNHARIHTGERPYVCEVPGCMKRFTEYSSLYKHNIVHTHQKPYTCQLCLKTYRQTSTLAMHKRTVHNTGDLTESERQVTIESSLRMKKPKISHENSRITSPPPTSTTGYIQGMSLIINNSDNNSQDFQAQGVSESTEIPGAIAIPIQVTMNPDGTIAGAPGLNLTDGNGRIIPVNLSVSIPMSSIAQVDGSQSDSTEQHEEGHTINAMYQNPASATNDGDNKLQTVMEILPDDTGEITPRQTQPNISSDDEDADDRDVTDKYLTSHYRQEVKSMPP